MSMKTDSSSATRTMFSMFGVLLSGLILTCSGCGSGEPPKPVGTVHGTVTLDGQPYTGAQVVFLALQTGQGGTANINPDGTYRILNPMWAGVYQVYLAPALPSADVQTEAVPVYMDEAVDEKFWNETSTDIVCHLKEGDNVFEVKLVK